MNILNFNEFNEKKLNEGVTIDLLKSAVDFIKSILNNAKKNKYLKYFDHVNSNSPKWIQYPNDRDFYVKSLPNKFVNNEFVFRINDNELVTGFLKSSSRSDEYASGSEKGKTVFDILNPAQVFVCSRTPIDLSSLEKVFDSEVNASYGKTNKKFTRKLILDNSKTLMDVSHAVDDYRNKKIDFNQEKRYVVVFEYTQSDAASETVTLADIQNTAEYKDIFTLPVELISSPLQIKKLTLVFAIKNSHIFNLKNPHQTLNTKYWYTGQALYPTGYVRNYSTSGSEHTVAGSFNSNTLNGWKDGLKQIKEKLVKRLKDIEKDGIIVDYKNPIDYKNIPEDIQLKLIDLVKSPKNDDEFQIKWKDIEHFLSPELKTKHRGAISGAKYGL